MSVSPIGRIDPELRKHLEEVRIRRYLEKVDRKMQTLPRMMRGVVNHPLFPQIKDDMMKAKMRPMNRRGQFGYFGLMGIFILMIAGLVGMVFFGAWIYGHNQVTDKLHTLTNPAGQNITGAADDTFGQVNSSLNLLRYVALAIFFGIALALFISAYYSQSHPLIFVIFIFIGLAAVITGAYVGNGYQRITETSIIGTEVTRFTALNFIYNNLTIWIAVFVVLIAVLFFLGTMKRREVELL